MVNTPDDENLGPERTPEDDTMDLVESIMVGGFLLGGIGVAYRQRENCLATRDLWERKSPSSFMRWRMRQGLNGPNGRRHRKSNWHGGPGSC